MLDRIEDRYIVYGEYAFAKHTVFYDRLPHYFLEFDIYDRSEETFLSTERRRALLAGLPIISVPVLAERSFRKLSDITDLVQPSLYKSPEWLDALALAATRAGVDIDRAIAETESSRFSEGLYLKVEQDGEVISRMKWIRRDFLQTILDSGTHWQDRPIIRNGLADNVDIYAEPVSEIADVRQDS